MSTTSSLRQRFWTAFCAERCSIGVPLHLLQVEKPNIRGQVVPFVMDGGMVVSSAELDTSSSRVSMGLRSASYAILVLCAKAT